MTASQSSRSASAPALVRLLLSPGALVARGAVLRALISAAVWIVLIVGVAFGVRLAMSSGVTGPASTPAAARVANGPVDAEGDPLTPSPRAATAYVSEQVMPAPVVRAAPAPARPAPQVAGSDDPPAPTGPTVATDREAQRTMQGLY